MSYVSKKGRRPNEYASKSSHSYIIKDKTVQEFLKKCNLPKEANEIEITVGNLIKLDDIEVNPINYIIAIDGGYSQVMVKREFPSSTITFFQFGALTFNINDLESMENKPFIEPEDISKLKKIQRFKFVMPTKNVSVKGEDSLINSIRNSLFTFFKTEPSDDSFIETLKWFIFEEYDNSIDEWNLASCPVCQERNIKLKRSTIKDYKFKCPYCDEDIYLIDVFRLHEAIDNELGAGGILGYLMTLLEQIVLIHLIRLILRTKPNLLNEILFIKDGPLAFFGQTANMHRPMRSLINYLFRKYNIFLAGLEKSGPFVEHADEIFLKLLPGQIVILNNNYIYKYILPGKADSNRPYGRTTYYGNKIIFKASDSRIYVVTLPTVDILIDPKKDDFNNIDEILHNIEKLKCDMYDSSLVPVALVNKLVSLSGYPSSAILEKFVKQQL